jgi:hypothetical protein
VATPYEAFQKVIAFLQQRKRAFQLAFSSPAGQIVLADLAKFCRAAESCYHDDPRKHAVLEGRREVFIRISDHLNLSTEQLYMLYGGKHVQVRNQSKGDEDE